MPKRSRIPYWTSRTNGSYPQDKNRFSRWPKRRAAISSMPKRSTHPTEPVSSIEHAMDVATGAEGERWERRRTAEG